MKNYLRFLKQLEDRNILVTQDKEIEGIPEEVFRMLRAKYGLAFVISKGTTYVWVVGEKIRKKIKQLEKFTGKYNVGKDDIGYFWS